MDTALLTQAGASGGIIAILLIVYRVFHMLNKKKFRSECCGKKASFSVSVDQMTPEVVVHENIIQQQNGRAQNQSDSMRDKTERQTVGELTIQRPASTSS